MTKEIWQQPEIITWNQLLLDSYKKLIGHDLIERTGNAEEEAKELFFSPFAVLSHGIEADPIYNYGNQVILDLWERSWDDLIKTPSRLSAEPMLREERQKILEKTTTQGYLKNYQGVRISRTGKQYKIEDVTIWNVLDYQGKYCGQTATFSKWSILE
ncbi:MAG: MEKHLA domain-containing protein [Moorea sp. SIO2B7]|nr:MEKHLA domain-containing protein [Moorena sp. SIO2B7]